VSVALLGTIVVPSISYWGLAPILILAGAALVFLVASAMATDPLPSALWPTLSIGAGLASGVVSMVLWHRVQTHGAWSSMDGALISDGFSALFYVLVSAAVVVLPLVAHPWLKGQSDRGPEMYALAMLSGSGAMLMAAAGDLITIFLGLEILSIALYVLAAFNRKREESKEAGLKYFVIGAFSSAVFLYGAALTYGATGTLSIAGIASFLAHDVVLNNGVLIAGMVLLLVGFGYKVAAVPFHTWNPDVYQGSPSPVTGFMAGVAKAGGFAALLRVFFASFPALRSDWRPVLWALAALSLVLGSVLAVVQTDVKRMLAYSSISHAGFVLVGVQAASARGLAAASYYLFTYTFMVLGSFAVLAAVGGDGDVVHDLSYYRGLARRHPYLALCFSLLLLAQAGVPLTTGFFAKFYVIGAAVAVGNYSLAILAMVCAVIVGFFYLRVVLAMYSSDGGELLAAAAGSSGGVLAVGGGSAVSSVPAGINWALLICVGFTVLFGFWGAPVIDFAQKASLLFGIGH
jgi:NADH-quinone oxidoreductase subunit N